MRIPINIINEHVFPVGKYFVDTDSGLIYSENRCNPGEYNTLTGFSDGRRGYLKVKLYNINKKGVTLAIHRIVYTVSNNIPYNSTGEINHINGIKTDNRLCNLELVTAKDNVRHSIINKLSESRAHQLTLDDAIQLYGWLVQNYQYYPTQKAIAQAIGYDAKVVRQLLTKTHTLSDEIEDYFNTNK